jgi:hypothetical protein
MKLTSLEIFRISALMLRCGLVAFGTEERAVVDIVNVVVNIWVLKLWGVS